MTPQMQLDEEWSLDVQAVWDEKTSSYEWATCRRQWLWKGQKKASWVGGRRCHFFKWPQEISRGNPIQEFFEGGERKRYTLPTSIQMSTLYMSCCNSQSQSQSS